MCDAPTDDLSNLPLVLTVYEFADLLRVSTRHAYQSINSGEVKAFRLGRKILIPRSEVVALMGRYITPGEADDA